MLILYGLQLIPISLVPRIPLSSVDGSFPWSSEFVSVLSFCQGLQKLFDGICPCCCCSWEISTGILLSIDIIFWCCFQYYIFMTGSFVVIHHSHNYQYDKGCCWHSQLLYSLHFRMVQFQRNSFSVCFCCTHYPPFDVWKVHLEDKFIVLLV